MVVSSRTPEGYPHRCPICGQTAYVEPSSPGGDSCCPRCGELLWWFRDRVSAAGGDPESLSLETTFADLGGDSLDTVELVMQLEEAFNIQIPDEAAEQIQTVEDAIRYIQERRLQD